MRRGYGSNTMGEMLSLWLFLHFSVIHGLDSICVFRDLKVIIEWDLNVHGIKSPFNMAKTDQNDN